MPLYKKTISIQDEGTDWGQVSTMNFVGTPVTAAVVDDVATITVTGGGGAPQGAVNSIQFNTSGAFGGVVGAASDGNWLYLLSSSLSDVPAPPAAGSVILFDHDIAGRQMLSMRGPSGIHTAFQPVLSRNNVGIWDHPGNTAATPSSWGLTIPTTSGTLTSRVVATTNAATMARRVGVVSTAVAGNVCGVFSTAAQFTMATGFHCTMRFIESDAAPIATARMWVGLTSQTTLNTGSTSPQPVQFINQVGVGYNSGQRNFEVFWAGAAGTQHSASLGNNFPANTGSLNFYDFTMFCAPSGTAVGFRMECINTGAVRAGLITSNLPGSTTLLAPQLWRCNGATAAAVGLDMVSVYMETDN